MKQLLPALIALLPLRVWAQQTPPLADSLALKSSVPPPSVPALTLNFSPLATLDPNTSTLLFGAEYRITQRVGVAVEYGSRFRALQLTGFGLTDNKNDFRYYKVKAEVRYYLPHLDKHPHQEMYVAFQPFYVPQTYTRYNSNYVIDDIHIGYDQALVDKKVMGADVKIGFIWHYGRYWQLEVGGGLGVRHVEVVYQTDRQFRETNASKFQVNMFNQTEKPDSYFDYDVSTVFKVGFRIPLRRNQ